MRNNTHRWLVLTTVAAAIGVGSFVAVQLLTSPPTVAFSLPPPGTPGTADTLQSAISEADTIVIGTITSTKLGRTVGPEQELGVKFFETTLQVTEVLKENQSTTLPPGTSVLIETEAATEIAPPQRGQTVVAFLWLTRDSESAGRYYRPITPEEKRSC